MGTALNFLRKFFFFLLFLFAYHNCYFQVKLKSWREDIYEFYLNKNFHLIQPLLWPKGPKHSYIYLFSSLLPLPPPYFLFFIFFPPFFSSSSSRSLYFPLFSSFLYFLLSLPPHIEFHRFSFSFLSKSPLLYISRAFILRTSSSSFTLTRPFKSVYLICLSFYTIIYQIVLFLSYLLPIFLSFKSIYVLYK